MNTPCQRTFYGTAHNSKEFTMEILNLETDIHTHTAIEALKVAYEKSSDNAAKESIITAFKAVIQLHLYLGKENCRDTRYESDCYDEYCAAV